MPIAITNTLVNGNVVDAPQLNVNFLDLAEPLRGDQDMDITIRHDHPTIAPLKLNQVGAGPIQLAQKSGVTRQTIDNNGNLIIKHADDPSITLDNDDASADRFGRWRATDAGLLVLESDTGIIQSIDLNTRILTFNQQPVLPQAKTRWVAGFILADPSTHPLNVNDQVQMVMIPGINFTAEECFIESRSGTGSGSYTVQIRKLAFNSGVETTLATIVVTTANNAGNTDIADHTFGVNDWLYFIVTARSSPLQRDVSISVRGRQTLVT